LGAGVAGKITTAMRALFCIYLGGIASTIAYFAVIGLTHH
jgi:hypothetical protein